MKTWRITLLADVFKHCATYYNNPWAEIKIIEYPGIPPVVSYNCLFEINDTSKFV